MAFERTFHYRVKGEPGDPWVRLTNLQGDWVFEDGRKGTGDMSLPALDSEWIKISGDSDGFTVRFQMLDGDRELPGSRVYHSVQADPVPSEAIVVVEAPPNVTQTSEAGVIVIRKRSLWERIKMAWRVLRGA